MKATILFLVILFPVILTAQTLNITITGLRNNSGNVSLGFYMSSESFKNEKPAFIKIEPKTKLLNGVLTMTYTGFKPGTYAIALMDDENANGKMDYRIILPNEGFGFLRNA